MKKILFSAAAVLGTAVYGQVGINTTSPKATFEVNGQPAVPGVPDGVIPPQLTREQLIAKTAYSTNQKGAMVYVTDTTGTTNTATAKVDKAGYYYFDGLIWQKAGGDDWSLTGNAGTTPSTSAIGTSINGNFIGTSDSRHLVIGTNNLEAIRIADDQRVGIGEIYPYEKLSVKGQIMFGKGPDANNVRNDYITGRSGGYAYRYTFPGNGTYDGGNWGNYYLADAGNSTTKSTFNLGVGSGALQRLTSGKNNLAIGWGAMRYLTTGSENISIGKQSGDGIAAGSQNIALGHGSLFVPNDAPVSGNIAVGHNSLRINSGNSNIGIGAWVMLKQSGSNNIIIGNNARLPYSTSGDNQINIGNVLSSVNGNVGIGQKYNNIYNIDGTVTAQAITPVERLEIDGNIKIGGTNTSITEGNTCTNPGTISYGADGNFYGCVGSVTPNIWKKLNN